MGSMTQQKVKFIARHVNKNFRMRPLWQFYSPGFFIDQTVKREFIVQKSFGV